MKQSRMPWNYGTKAGNEYSFLLPHATTEHSRISLYAILLARLDKLYASSHLEQTAVAPTLVPMAVSTNQTSVWSERMF